ncbi:MAG: hypothetical protein ACK2UU_16460, partial [Anaerolineae bacterium]
MTRPIQCDNCGAVLLEEDIFCGECGAPRPSVIASAEPIDRPPAQASATAPPVRKSDSDTVWRVVAAILGVVGALLCLLGFAAFLLFGLIDSEGVSQAENWLISTICCLLPIAGTGAAIA